MTKEGRRWMGWGGREGGREDLMNGNTLPVATNFDFEREREGGKANEKLQTMGGGMKEERHHLNPDIHTPPLFLVGENT